MKRFFMILISLILASVMVFCTACDQANNDQNENEDTLIQSKYNSALSLMEEGKYSEAISEFEKLDGYGDSLDKIEACNIAIYGEELWNKLKDITVGSYYTMGTFEQDNDTKNGKEPIEWQVLAIDGSKLLLVSRYALECLPYNSSGADATWETTSLRNYLNKYFIERNFTAEEQKLIVSTTVTAESNPEYELDAGNDTVDKVFILSPSEIEKYFGFGAQSSCPATEYAKARGAFEGSNGNTWLWVRATGSLQNRGLVLLSLGYLYSNGDHSAVQTNAVRPAMWIDINN